MPRKKKEEGPVDGCADCEGSVNGMLAMTFLTGCEKHGYKRISVEGLFKQAVTLESSISDRKAHQMGRHAVAVWVLQQIAGPGNFDIKKVADTLIGVMNDAQRIIDAPETGEEVAP